MTAPANKQITVLIQKSANAAAANKASDPNKVSSTESNAVFTVTAHLEESFDFGISAEYQAPYANIANDVVSAIPLVGRITKATPITSPYLSSNYWQGSETQEMTINIVIEADSDPLTEVRIPVLNLLSLVAPRVTDGGAMMLSPVSQITLPEEQVAKMVTASVQAVAETGATVVAASSSLFDTIDSLKDKAEELKTNIQNNITAVADNLTGGLISSAKNLVNKAENFCNGLVDSFNNTLNNAADSAIAGIGNALGLDLTNDSSKELSSQKAANKKDSKEQAAEVTKSANAGAFSPTMAMVANLKNTVSIKIGTYAYFPAVIVTNVNVSFMHNIDAYTGWPLSAAVQLTFRPMFTQTVGDVEQVFQSAVTPATSQEYVDKQQDPINGTLTSALTAPITKTIKSAANSLTEAATDLADKATSSIKNMLPFGDDEGKK